MESAQVNPAWMRARAAPSALGALAWLAATAAAAAILGAMAGRGEAKAALVPAAALLAMFLARFPAAGYVALAWTVATAIDLLALPEIRLSSFRFGSAEILLWLTLGSLAFLPRAERRVLARLTTQRESLVLGLFLIAVIGGVAVGVENGATLHAALFDMRSMLFYAAFWPALAALRFRRNLTFGLVSFGVVAVVILQIGQVIVGPSTHLFLIYASDLSSTLTTSDGGGFLRVRPPGLTAVYIVAAFAAARVLWGPRRGRWRGWALSAVTLTGIVLSLNRNMLLGLGLGLCVAFAVAPQKHRFVVVAAVVGTLLLSFSLLTQGSSVGSNPVVSRYASISNYGALKTQTLGDRYYENHIALQRIRHHPIGGLGWGLDYGAVLLSTDDGVPVSTPRSFMHEQYLWIWMRAGIVGLLALISTLVLGVWNGAQWCRARVGVGDGWLGAGVVAALVAVAASSNVAIYLTAPDSTVPLVGVLALAAILRRDLRRQ